MRRVNPWRMFRRARQPMKTVMAVYELTFVLAVASVFVGRLTLMGVSFAALGASAVGVGLLLAANVNDAAVDWAAMIGHERPFGVDYSSSVFARPAFVRLFGLPMAVIGIVFVAAGIAQAT
jgi:hypothetical protein